jgi:two-component system sensor histidine kinase HydH
MPIFIDGHDLPVAKEVKFKKIVNSIADKHGVTHKEILYNKNENRCFCINEAPNRQSIEKYHENADIECDFIYQTDSMKTEFEERMKRLCAIGELSSRVAHDLRNPLGIIKNAVELMEMSSTINADEKTKKRIQMIKNAAERMLRQITNVLDFVRVKPLQLEKSSLGEILDSAIKSSVPDTVKIRKPQNDVKLLCDGKQLETVFCNILLNAVQAMDHSGDIKVSIVDGKNEIKISIEDSGPGISKENLQHIFEPFFTTKQGGTGLGLVSCKNIVEQHEGKIIAKTNPTTFEIILPKLSN